MARYIGLFGIFALVQSGPLCEDYRQCLGEVFNHESGNVACSGFQSCMAVDQEMNIFSHNKVTCSGEQSCASAYISTSSALKCTAAEGCSKMRAEAKGRVYCSSDRSCAAASIVKHYTGDDIDDLVHCDSENACREATITGYGNGVECNGLNSCKSSVVEIMETTEGSFTDIACNGLSSCESAWLKGSAVLCNGMKSCSWSRMSAAYILAENREALSNSQIFGKLNEELMIDVLGHKALNGAIINSFESSMVNINLYGYHSGNNGKLICLDSAICSVSCKTNACKGFTMQCEEGSTCNVAPEDCEHSANYGKVVNGVHCPSVIGSSNEYVKTVPYEDPDAKEDEAKEDENFSMSFTAHNTVKSLLSFSGAEVVKHAHGICLSNDECLGETMNLEQEIKCHGPSSCKTASIKTTQELSCNGDESCKGSPELTSESAVNCGGYESCNDAHLIQSNGEKGLISCSGPSSCAHVGLISSADGYMTFGGKQSAAESIIRDDKDASLATSYAKDSERRTIDCDGEEACLNAHISAKIAGSIYCQSRRSCAGATIKPNGINSGSAQVYCNGLESCQDAVIDGAKYGVDGPQQAHFFCLGRDCGKNAEIKQITHITVYGTMPGAFIDAGTLTSDTPISIKMYGHLSGKDVTVKARLNTRANLVCKGNGCKGLTYDCYDNFGKSGKVCSIEPKACMLRSNSEQLLEEEGIFCPKYIPSKNKRGGDEDYFVNEAVHNQLKLVDAVSEENNGYGSMENATYLILAGSFSLFLIYVCYRASISSKQKEYGALLE